MCGTLQLAALEQEESAPQAVSSIFGKDLGTYRNYPILKIWNHSPCTCHALWLTIKYH